MRIAFKMKLKPGCEPEYRRRHDQLWPQLRDLLKSSGITHYTIFHDPQTDFLFAVQDLSGKQTSQDLGSHEIVQRWWAHMADLMETNDDNSPATWPMNEVFHLD